MKAGHSNPDSLMGEFFDWCVAVLHWIGEVTGTTYEEANIWVFVVIHPLITLILLILWIRSLKK